jgi:hypothetical protein
MEKSEIVSQEQPQEELPQTSAEIEEGDDALALPVKGKRRAAKKGRLVDAESVSPRPSYWPLFSAFSVAMFIAGAIGNPYLMVIGAVLVVVCIVGWIIERR